MQSIEIMTFLTCLPTSLSGNEDVDCRQTCQRFSDHDHSFMG